MDEDKKYQDVFEHGRFSGENGGGQAEQSYIAPTETVMEQEQEHEQTIEGQEQTEQTGESQQFSDPRFFDPGILPLRGAQSKDNGAHSAVLQGEAPEAGADRRQRDWAAAERRPKKDRKERPLGMTGEADREYFTVVSNRVMTVALTLTITTFAVLLIAFLVVLFCLTDLAKGNNGGMAKETPVQGTEKAYSYEAPEKRDKEAMTEEEQTPSSKSQGSERSSGTASQSEYGELTDAIRTDLSYDIEWVNYEYEGNNDVIELYIDYPQIVGDVPNLELINREIEKETEYFEEFIAEYAKYMLEDEVFYAYVEAFITYMDEDTLSIVFNETMYTDYWTDQGLFCINIDVAGGMILDNQNILDVNEEFSVEFRRRSKDRYGEESALDYMTDQEVQYYLTEPDIFIIFYTPVGMEIGINYGESYSTVTYTDYEKFLKKV